MSDSDGSRTVDEATLRYIARLLGRQDAVDTTSLFPATKPETLVVRLDTEGYPADIDEVSLEIRAYTNGEFHVSYLEGFAGDRRRCRWDRHDQPHSARDHFNPLSDARTDAAADRTYPTDLTRVLETTVLPWVQDRLGTLWR